MSASQPGIGSAQGRSRISISGISSDLRDVEREYANGNDRARLALEVYAYHIRKYIGSYAAVLGGLDAIVFTGGIGEKSALVGASVGAQGVLGIVTVPGESLRLRVVVDGKDVIGEMGPTTDRGIRITGVVGADHVVHQVLGIDQAFETADTELQECPHRGATKECLAGRIGVELFEVGEHL